MSTPFAYLSATLNEWKEPLVVQAGQPLELRYAVALWDGEVEKATVEKLYQRWLELSGAAESIQSSEGVLQHRSRSLGTCDE